MSAREQTLPPLPRPHHYVAEEPGRHGMHQCYLNEQNVSKYGRESVYVFGFTAQQMQAYASAAIASTEPAVDPPWQGCTVPPEGWWCSRTKGHKGPCAARPGKPPESPAPEPAPDHTLLPDAVFMRLCSAGNNLSNCAFNLAQTKGEPLSERAVATLDQCRREWDAARSACHDAIEAAPGRRTVRGAQEREAAGLSDPAQDTKRLDWLDIDDINLMPQDDGRYRIYGPKGEVYEGANIRAAIDAAMKEQSPGAMR